MNKIPRIVSGGQTGADRAALDWALSHNLPCGGWCPKGRKAEDGTIDPKYPLKESSSGSYLQRTEWNVLDSDATVLFFIAPSLSGGSKKTVEFAKKHNKPCHFTRASKMPHRGFTLSWRTTWWRLSTSQAQEPAKSQTLLNLLSKRSIALFSVVLRAGEG